jgi:hypothetical protein
MGRAAPVERCLACEAVVNRAEIVVKTFRYQRSMAGQCEKCAIKSFWSREEIPT